MPSEPMSDEIERLTAERDALQRHYDAASPEHDLLGLLDSYYERELAAGRERDEALESRDLAYAAEEALIALAYSQRSQLVQARAELARLKEANDAK